MAAAITGAGGSDRSRQPVNARFLNALQSACAVFLIGFMLFIAFYDTGDWVRSADRKRTVSSRWFFAPKK